MFSCLFKTLGANIINYIQLAKLWQADATHHEQLNKRTLRTGVFAMFAVFAVRSVRAELKLLNRAGCRP